MSLVLLGDDRVDSEAAVGDVLLEEVEHLVPDGVPVLGGMELLQPQAGGGDLVAQPEVVGVEGVAVGGGDGRQKEVTGSVRGEVEVSGFIDEDVESRHGKGIIGSRKADRQSPRLPSIRNESP